MSKFECAYCGIIAKATDDHIPPKSFFVGPLTTDLPSVKACASCNTGASLDDEYFRDTVVKHHQVADQPAANPVVQKMLRAAALPARAKYTRHALSDMVDLDVTTPSGIILGKQPAFRVDGSRLERAAARYARGLHRYHYGERVPSETPIRAVVNPDQVNQNAADFVTGFRGADIVTIQDGVFWYARMRPTAQPNSSYWMLTFFSAFPIVVAIRPDTPLPRAGAV